MGMLLTYQHIGTAILVTPQTLTFAPRRLIKWAEEADAQNCIFGRQYALF